jgi:hypothetical protein
VQQTSEIAAWPRQSADETRANRVGHVNEYDWDRAGLPVQCAGDLSGMCKQHIGPQVDQLFREGLRLRTSGRKTSLDVDITALRPSEPLQLLSKFHDARLGFRIVLGQAHQHPDAPHPLRLLRARRERPRCRRAAEKGDEHAAFCMTGKEHCEGRRGLGHDRTPVAAGSPQAFRTLIRE